MSRLTRLDQRGIALPIALFALVIIAALLAGSFYMGRMEQHHGDNTVARAQASEAAEAGLAATVAAWNTGAYNAMANASEITLSTVTVGGTNTYTPTLRRINQATFLVRSEGRHLSRTGAVITRQQLGRLVRLTIPAIDMTAAITTRVGISVSGSSDVSGHDSVPPSLAGFCPPPGASAPGIRDSSGNVSTSGACSGASCIAGSPQILTDPTVNSGSFNQFGDLSFADLAAMANKTLAAGATYNGIGPTVNTGPPPTCRITDLSNWGDPATPTGLCFSYFPIIYAPGDVRLTGGQGQGILLVAGDLDISGGFEFYGPVIVQGGIRSTGTGGHIVGGVMAQNALLNTSLITGNSNVTFSRCAISRALQGSATARTLGSRSWSQLY
jgi:hypothetical protein